MFIAYIYDLNNNVIAQIEELLDVQVTKKLNDVSIASFGLYHTNEYCNRTILKEYRRVKIVMIVGSTEKIMFEGVIRGFDSDIEKASIKCESLEHFLDRRLLHSDYTFTSQSIDSILTSIIGDMNTRYQTNITVDCGIITLTTKTYKRGESILKTLQDLAGNGYEFIVDGFILKFKITIGENKSGSNLWNDLLIWDDTQIWTDGSNTFIEYKYDINEPDDRSIDSVTMTVDGKNLANGVIGKVGNTYSDITDTPSISEFGLIESSFTSYGDDTATTQSFLNDHKNSLSEFNIGTITNDFFEADLGDIIKVYVYVGNDLMFIDSPMKIIQKQYEGGDLPNITFTLGKTKVKSKDIIEQIGILQSRVKTLEFK